MPPTFLLFLLIVLVACSAPFVLIGALVAACVRRTRRLGLQMLVWGAGAAALAAAGDALLGPAWGDGTTLSGAAFCAGEAFTVAVVLVLLTHVWRREAAGAAG